MNKCNCEGHRGDSHFCPLHGEVTHPDHADGPTMSDKPEPCQNDKCILFDKDAVMGINCLDGLNFPCRLHSAKQIPQPSEVYDRIQGYIRVIQEKDALIADLAKPSELCHKCRGTGTIPMGGNDGASCFCDCKLGQLKDETIKALGFMLGRQQTKIAELEADKERLDWLDKNRSDLYGVSSTPFSTWTIRKTSGDVAARGGIREVIDKARKPLPSPPGKED